MNSSAELSDWIVLAERNEKVGRVYIMFPYNQETYDVIREWLDRDYNPDYCMECSGFDDYDLDTLENLHGPTLEEMAQYMDDEVVVMMKGPDPKAMRKKCGVCCLYRGGICEFPKLALNACGL